MGTRKRIVVLGSTGSIGRQTLDVVCQHSDKLEVVALAAHGSVDALLAQARAFGVRHVALGDPAAAASPSFEALERTVFDGPPTGDVVMPEAPGGGGTEMPARGPRPERHYHL